jgi:hypothetical protein
MLDIYFVSVKYVLVSVKLMCVYVKLLKKIKVHVKRVTFVTYSRTSVRVSGGGYVHSSGRSVTRLTAYHTSRHVASTFKRLTTTTTHCDLIKFLSTQTGFLPRS